MDSTVEFKHLAKVPKIIPSVPFTDTLLDKAIRKIGHGKPITGRRKKLQIGNIDKCGADDYFKTICHDQRKTTDMRKLALTATHDGRVSEIEMKNRFINRRSDAFLRSRKFEDRNLKTDEIIKSDLYWRNVKEPEFPRHFREMENPKDIERLYLKKPTTEGFMPEQEKQTFDDRYPTKSLGQGRQQRLAVERGLTDWIDRKYNPYRDQPLEDVGRRFFRTGTPKDINTLHYYFSNFLQEKGMITPTDRFIKFRTKVATLLQFDEEQVKFIEQIIATVPKNRFKLKLRELIDFSEFMNEQESKYSNLEKIGAKYTPITKRGLITTPSYEFLEKGDFSQGKVPFHIKLKVKDLYDNISEFAHDDPILKEMLKIKKELHPRIRFHDNYSTILKHDDPIVKEMLKIKKELHPRIRLYDNYSTILKHDDPILKKLGAKQKIGKGSAKTGEYILPFGIDMRLDMIENGALNIPQIIKLKDSVKYLTTIADKKIGDFVAEQINHDFRDYCKRSKNLVKTEIDPETLDDRIIKSVKAPSGWEKHVGFKEDIIFTQPSQKISTRKATGSFQPMRAFHTKIEEKIEEEEEDPLTDAHQHRSIFSKYARKSERALPLLPV